MSNVPVSAARSDLAAVIATAEEQAVHLQRRGRTVAVLISSSRYDELMEAAENLEDIAAYDEAMADADPTIPWEQVRVDLGWT